jgi:branched-chain amino acid transport system permease protein
VKLGRDFALVTGLLLAGAAVPSLAGDYWVSLGISLLMSVALTQSWSVLSGLSGYISLGHVVFYGLGAWLVVVSWGVMPLWVSLVLTSIAAPLFAALVGAPVLRVRGPYFVILTFGLAELVKYVVIAIESSLGHASRLLLGTPQIESIFYMMLTLALISTALAWWVRATRLGRGLRAIRENEEAAETLGVPVARYKLAAFVLSAVVPGAVGGVMALRSTYFEPLQAFDLTVSFNMIAAATIGGSDDLRGPVVGAALLTLLFELLWAHAPQLYMIIMGALLIVFVLFVPEGVCGRLAHTRRHQ